MKCYYDYLCKILLKLNEYNKIPTTTKFNINIGQNLTQNERNQG